MDAQMKKGLLDVCVLSILSREDTYGYRLTQEVYGLLETSESALYPVLRRLEGQGLLETYSVEYSGRLRKYYRITAAGKLKLRESLQELAELKKVIDHIMGGDNDGRQSGKISG